MSARREHQRRRDLRLEYRVRVKRWLAQEPPRWRIFSWRRWMARKPMAPKGVKLRRCGA